MDATDDVAHTGFEMHPRRIGELVVWGVVWMPLVLWGIGGGMDAAVHGRGARGLLFAVGQGAGLVGMAMLSVSFVLSARLRWLEPYFGGLDGLYRVHHRLGVAAVAALSVHPLAYAVRFLPGEPGRALGLLLPGHARWAVDAGVYAFWSLLLLMGLTFASWVPYDKWKGSHKALALVLVGGAVHMWFMEPTRGQTVAVATQLGLRAYMTSLVGVGLVAATYKTLVLPLWPQPRYTVASVERRNADVMEVTLSPEGALLDFVPGQFVFVTVHDEALPTEAHPYTLCGPAEAETLSITVKALGDYTRRLYNCLESGMTVSLEGPYGRFDYRTGGNRQVWVAGGVGVAPFLSWARNRARDNTVSSAVDFYYCVHDRSDAVYLDELEALAREASWLNVQLVCSVEDGHLHADDIANLDGVDLFLCGPQSLTRDLRRQCRQRGVPDRRIHFEDFEFR